MSGDEKQRSINDSIDSCSSCMSNGIPEALSFDRIISGGVCPVSKQPTVTTTLIDSSMLTNFKAMHHPRLHELS